MQRIYLLVLLTIIAGCTSSAPPPATTPPPGTDQGSAPAENEGPKNVLKPAEPI
jgi:hypothetical protein